MFDKAMKKSIDPYLASGAELLSAVPIADVESVDLGKGMMTKPITLAVWGESFQVEAPKAANAKDFVAAYERARGATQPA